MTTPNQGTKSKQQLRVEDIRMRNKYIFVQEFIIAILESEQVTNLDHYPLLKPYLNMTYEVFKLNENEITPNNFKMLYVNSLPQFKKFASVNISKVSMYQ